MRIKIYSGYDKEYDCTTYYDIKAQTESGKELSLNFSNCSDCPEDATLERAMNDVFSITELVEMAYLAGKEGEDLEFENIEDEE